MATLVQCVQHRTDIAFSVLAVGRNALYLSHRCALLQSVVDASLFCVCSCRGGNVGGGGDNGHHGHFY